MENTPQQISLSELLHKLSDLAGSDLHITTGTPPLVRVHGEIRPLDGYRPLTSSETKQLAYSVLTDAQKHRFEENLELDFSFGVKGLSRFRANIFNQRGAVGAGTDGASGAGSGSGARPIAPAGSLSRQPSRIHCSM